MMKFRNRLLETKPGTRFQHPIVDPAFVAFDRHLDPAVTNALIDARL